MTIDAIVVDASALVLAFTDGTEAGSRGRARMRDHVRHAPHLIDAEVGNVLRRLRIRGVLGQKAADEARTFSALAVTRRHPHTGRLGQRAWELADNLTFYDGLYVALAELIGCPLLTSDARLRAAPGPRCPIELISAAPAT